jgi:cytochrome P450
MSHRELMSIEARGPSEGCPVAPAEFERLLELDQDALRLMHESLRALRDIGPVTWVEPLSAFAVTGYDEVVNVLMDHETFSSALGDPKGPVINRRIADAHERLQAKSGEFDALVAQFKPDWRQPACLLNADPPLHSQQRKVVNRLFTPRRVARLEPRMREIANELIDAFAARGHAEIAGEYAIGLPLRVIAEQLGVAPEHVPDLQRWSDHMVSYIGNDKLEDDDVVRNTRSQVEFTRFFLEQIEDRRREPRDDFVSLMLGLGEDDESDPDELRLSYIAQILQAGTETTRKLIAAAVGMLARDHALADRLRADPAAVPAFIEEALRLESPLQGLYRYTSRQTILAGVTIPKGAAILVFWASGNRIDETFPQPDQVDLERANLTRHLAFGRGPHHCVGAGLARLEGVVGISTLLERLPNWTVAEDLGGERYIPSYILHGHHHLWIEFGGRPSVGS